MKPVVFVNICGVFSVLWFLACEPRTNPPSSSSFPAETKSVPTAAVVPSPSVQIIAPETDTVGLRATFRWRIQGMLEGEVYRYKVRLDKGQNACDGGKVEDEFDAGTETCLTVNLSRSRYSHERVEFAVVATDSQGRSFCTRGKSLLIDPRNPAAAGCATSKPRKE